MSNYRDLMFNYRVDTVESILRRGQLTTAQQIADELRVDQRSIYRYIAALRKRGFTVLSGKGVGYLFKEKIRV